MNRNAKIGIGCGAVGCLGLIVLAIGLGGFFYWRSTQVPEENRANRNFNFNINSSSNSNSNSTNTSEPDTNTSSSSSYSDDEKHKLFTAATFSQDSELLMKTLKELGLYKADNTPSSDYEEFVKDHVVWTLQNMDFVNTVNSPEKARAYVESHMKD